MSEKGIDKILREIRNGKQFRSYDGGITWISSRKFNQEEHDQQTEEIERKKKNGEILTITGGFADLFTKDFKDKFLTACNQRDVEKLLFNYQLAIIGFKDNIPGFNEVDFIDVIIKESQNIIEQENKSLSFNGIRTASKGKEFIQALEERKAELIGIDKPKKYIDARTPNKLNMAHVALLCYYRKELVNKQTASRILENYREEGLNSIDALVGKYNGLYRRSQRTGGGKAADLSIKTRKKYIEDVIGILEASGDNSVEAKTDLELIAANLRNDTEV